MPKSIDEVYNIKKVRAYIRELENLLNLSPRPYLDSGSSYVIIDNLVKSLRYSVDVIEYLRKTADIEQRVKISTGSNAKN